MPAASDLLRLLGLSAAVVLGAAACGPQVQIILVKGEDLEATPEFVRFEFADLTTNELERFGPYATAGLPGEEFAEVAPDHTFLISVIGCKTSVEDECLAPDTYLAHGCSGEEKLARGEAKTLEITVHSADTGARECGITEVIE